MTDPSDPSGGEPRLRRPPSVGDSPAPFTTVTVLVAAAVAVIAGLVILRTITDGSAASSDVPSAVATTVATPSTTSVAPSTTTATTTTSTTTTTVPPASKSDATVVVANASGVDGSATAMTDELRADGYTTAPVANATGPRLQRSIIYFLQSDPAAFGVARLLAEQIPTAQTLPMPDPPPLDRPLAGATVALLLGADAAGRELTDLQSG